MSSPRAISRRKFIKSTSVAGLSLAGATGCGTTALTPGTESALIIKGTNAALEKSLVPALLELAYPGHFTIAAEGRTYGKESTWPGLDSWQMAGAYLLAGRHREMLDYFDFIQASQRQDGNVPFAIFRGDKPHPSLHTWLRAMRYPEDVFTYTPKVRPGQPRHADLKPRQWIGLFTHWQISVNPLSVLGAVSYVLTAGEIWTALKSESWLTDNIASVENAGRYVLSRLSPNGLMGGAGFYMEAPPRHQWDGVTQCYGVYAFRQLAALNQALGRQAAGAEWTEHAKKLATRFGEFFWQQDHFAEYVHPERGVVDTHGLSDVNWAAIGLGVANDQQAQILWSKLTAEKAFWLGDMPTHVVTKPRTYEAWELPEPVPFKHTKTTYDVAAMGRVWHLEALACLRMRDHRRLRESVIKVCQMGRRHGWFWYERYPATWFNRVKPVGTYGYCEYPSILVRVVLGNPGVFPEAKQIQI
jgi:hypothetical protein